MTSEQAWNNIISKLTGKCIELHTAPKVQRTPLWFSVTTDGDKIYINNAIKNRPSCKLSMERKLSYDIFQKVYPLYLRREKGESVSAEVTAVTVNQVYFFSLIKHLA